MREPMTEASPSPSARAIGVVYLSYVLVSILGFVPLRGLVRAGDAAATASNILGHESWYLSGVSLGIVANALYLALTALFCGLFAPVNRSISFLAAFFGLAGCVIQLCGGVLLLAPLVLLKGMPPSSAIGVEQLRIAALLSLKLYNRTWDISFVLFAFFDLAIGYLIFRSGFLPRVIGVLMMLGGLGAVTYLWPPLARSLSLPYTMGVGGVAELSLMLWLLVKGIDVPRWREWAGVRASDPSPAGQSSTLAT